MSREAEQEYHMQRYKKLRPNLFSADLHYGKIDIKPDHYFSCFFIVQHTDDREFIKEQMIQLLLSGCRWFDFYGDKGAVWEASLEEAHRIVLPKNSVENTIRLNRWDTIEGFVAALNKSISMRPIVPCDHFLLYDDMNIYEAVVDQVIR